MVGYLCCGEPVVRQSVMTEGACDRGGGSLHSGHKAERTMKGSKEREILPGHTLPGPFFFTKPHLLFPCL